MKSPIERPAGSFVSFFFPRPKMACRYKYAGQRVLKCHNLFVIRAVSFNLFNQVRTALVAHHFYLSIAVIANVAVYSAFGDFLIAWRSPWIPAQRKFFPFSLFYWPLERKKPKNNLGPPRPPNKKKESRMEFVTWAKVDLHISAAHLRCSPLACYCCGVLAHTTSPAARDCIRKWTRHHVNPTIFLFLFFFLNSRFDLKLYKKGKLK